MHIACLGWGSLIWNPGRLPLQGEWQNDGPLLPNEFARQSQDDRITLVLVPGRRLVQTYWAMVALHDLDAAREALRDREGIPTMHLDAYIGVWTRGKSPGDDIMQNIQHWAEPLSLHAVIWTALPPKFQGQDGIVPSVEQVIARLRHLQSVQDERAHKAEQYIRMAPRQIATDYRQTIEARLQWLP